MADGLVEYRDTLDYTWVIARQLDRIAEAMTMVSFEAPGPGVARVYSAMRALLAVARPFVPRQCWLRLERAALMIQRGRPLAALAEMELALADLLAELDRKGLLLYKRSLAVGGFEG